MTAVPGDARPEDGARFGILGPLQVADGTGTARAIPAPKQRIVLAALLLRTGCTVSQASLAEALWDACPPVNAPAVMRTYVSRLRSAMGLAGARIATHPPGWAVELGSPEELDLTEAEQRWQAARAAASAGEWRQASSLLAGALSLWRGEPLADIPSADLARREAGRLAELRLQLTDARIDADLRLGRHDELLPELRQLAAEHPLNERIWAQLMLACYRCGHQAAALQAYREARATLAGELGVEPGHELREMHQRILTADPDLTPSTPGAVTLSRLRDECLPEAGRQAADKPAGQDPGFPGDMREPGIWLRMQRETAGLTQEELADRSGLSVRAISNLERGRTRMPHPATLRLVAGGLGLPEPAAAELIARCRAARHGAAGGRRSPARDAGSRPVAPPGNEMGGPAGSLVVPRQLPAPVATFAGRAAELATLDEWLGRATGSGDRRGLAVSAISGMAGAGKTALALQWAHQIADRFPDGQLYANLRGFGPAGQPADAGQVVRGFLQALGVRSRQIPAAMDARTALYRSMLAGRRMLIVADNARNPEQVRPLLPGTPGSAVVVTSRSSMGGLAAAEGARVITLDVPSQADAAELLTRRLGRDRIAAEPDAAAELIGLCGRLPLALAVVAARASQPDWPLSELAAQLARAGERLGSLTLGDPAADVRAAFSWSCRQLSAESARMFRLLAVHPGPDISVPAAASLAGVSVPGAQGLLRELADAAMAAEHLPGRYVLHALLRDYAAEQARTGSTGAEYRAGTLAIRDHYLNSATAAADAMDPARRAVHGPPVPVGIQEPAAGSSEALAWFDAEHEVLLAVSAQAARDGSDDYARQLARTLQPFRQLHRRPAAPGYLAAGRTRLLQTAG